jgi:hypothetical protein
VQCWAASGWNGVSIAAAQTANLHSLCDARAIIQIYYAPGRAAGLDQSHLLSSAFVVPKNHIVLYLTGI